ncbi:WD domain, G-beta repeat [Novymonas esmeraldas]|uniref:WD domain, G-beta repeat n=1 Tax=Novymonas esmeraldas TaxID=1808958 RepID=A0AAW0EZX6_9TRYP
MFANLGNAHTEVVTSLVFSPHAAASGGDGDLLCSTSGDDTAALWDLRVGPGASRRTAHLTGHHVGPVNHALFHPADPNTLLTASDDCTIGCWDLRRPDRVVGSITGFREGVNKMLWLPVPSAGCGGGGGGGWGVVSACDDGHVYVHAFVAPDTDAPRTAEAVPQVGALLDKFRVSTSTVNDMVLAPNSTSILITASEDAALRSWSLRHAQQLPGTTAAAGLTEDRLLASLDEFENPVNHVAVVPSGLMAPLETCTAGGGETGAALTSAALGRTGEDGGDDDDEGDEDGNSGGAASGAGSTAGAPRRAVADVSEAAGTGCWLVAACSECVFGVDMALRSGEFGTGARAFVKHEDYVRGLEFTNAGTLLTVSDDSTAVEWSLATTAPLRQMKLHEGMIMSSAMSPSRSLLATGTDSGEIRVWRVPFAT